MVLACGPLREGLRALWAGVLRRHSPLSTREDRMDLVGTMQGLRWISVTMLALSAVRQSDSSTPRAALLHTAASSGTFRSQLRILRKDQWIPRTRMDSRRPRPFRSQLRIQRKDQQIPHTQRDLRRLRASGEPHAPCSLPAEAEARPQTPQDPPPHLGAHCLERTERLSTSGGFGSRLNVFMVLSVVF